MTRKNKLENRHDTSSLAKDVSDVVKEKTGKQYKVLLFLMIEEDVFKISDFSEDDYENFKYLTQRKYDGT